MTIEEWLNGNKIGVDIWHKKYQYNNETFDEFIKRISGGNSSLERLILQKKFLPAGRILSNRGLNKHGVKSTLSNCYVLSVDDSIESIYKAAGEIARTYSYGGGVGIDISKLRPRGAVVNNNAKTTTGAVSFMKTFDVVTGTIGQNNRRGALMLSLSSEHPDLEEFINVKANTTEIKNANISVRVSDEFMKAVENDEDYLLRFPIDTDLTGFSIDKFPYDKLITIEGPHNVYIKKVKAKRLFDRLVENNWDYAEPGMLYWNNIENNNFLQYDDSFQYAGVNPCSEEPLPNGGACLLGSINLGAFVKDGKFQYKDFELTVETATKALNEVLDEGLSLHPLAIQRQTAKDWRQIGLGIMGLADCLIKLGIRYGSKKSIELCNIIGSIMLNKAVETSAYLAMKEGTYPCYNSKAIIASDMFKLLTQDVRKLVKQHGLRNSQLLCIAPTGTLSTMLNISGGVEPFYELKSYIRTTKSLHDKDTDYTIQADTVGQYMKEHNIEKVEDLPDFFTCAKTMDYNERIQMQAIWQKYIDASISSTLNLKKETTKEEVYNIYMNAWKSKLKGITIFRDGCGRVGILNTEKPVEMMQARAPKRPKELPADYYEVKVHGKLFIVVVGLFQDRPYEIFCYRPKGLVTNVGKQHGVIIKNKKMSYTFKSDAITINNLCKTSSTAEERAATLYISMLLRHGVAIKYVVKTAKKVDSNIVSFTAALCRVLNKYVPTETISEKCPECGGDLIRENGCIHCSCGWSRCE